MKTDLTKCPECGGPADNGHDRCYPPNPYFCSKCEANESTTAMTKDTPLNDEKCIECGMPCTAGEYHPYAACLMFMACHDSTIVRANLSDARDLERDLAACRAVVRELLAVADLWASIESERDVCLFGLPANKEWWDKRDDHAIRKPLAWSAARAILQTEGETK